MTGDYQDEEYHQQNHQKQQQYDNTIVTDQNPTFRSTTTTSTGLQLNSSVNGGENIALTDNTNSPRMVLLKHYKLTKQY